MPESKVEGGGAEQSWLYEHTTRGSGSFFGKSEEIEDVQNVQRAFKQVSADKGAGRMDVMQTDVFKTTNWQSEGKIN